MRPVPDIESVDRFATGQTPKPVHAGGGSATRRAPEPGPICDLEKEPKDPAASGSLLEAPAPRDAPHRRLQTSAPGFSKGRLRPEALGTPGLSEVRVQGPRPWLGCPRGVIASGRASKQEHPGFAPRSRTLACHQEKQRVREVSSWLRHRTIARVTKQLCRRLRHVARRRR